MRKYVAAALAGVMATSSMGMSAVQAAPLGGAPMSAINAAPAVENDSVVEVRGHRYRHRGGYYRYDRRGDAAGAAAAAGVIGLAAGVIAGQALAAPRGPAYAGETYVDPDWLDYCYARYRSFDPHSGTYMGYDGRRYLCRRPGID